MVKFKLTRQGMEEPVMIEALSFPTICTPLPPMMKLDNYPCLNDLELADDLTNQSTTIDVLIGSDYYWALVTGEVLKTNGGPTAVSSKLGWLLSGPIQASYGLVTVSNLAVSQGIHYPLSTSEDEALLGALKCFWQLESLGIAEEPTGEDNPETFLADVQFTGNRYTVNLPWKIDPQELPDHQQMCTNRLRALLHRLQKDKRMLKEYDQVIQEQIKQGIVEKVPSVEGHGPVHYLPHLPVVRADRTTTKIRVVYDGSAKTSDSMLSLNDCLHKGPNLIPKGVDRLS